MSWMKMPGGLSGLKSDEKQDIRVKQITLGISLKGPLG
jgi:hypothetical protein